MSTPKKYPATWQEALKVISRCPVCNQEYRAEQARVFAKQESARLVHFACANCQSAFVAMIVFMSYGLSSLGMVTDLNFEDVQRLHQAEPITVDEIIEGHLQVRSPQFVSQLV